MPYNITHLANGGYQVKNPITGQIHAKRTSLANARSQVKLLHAIEHNPYFMVNKAYK